LECIKAEEYEQYSNVIIFSLKGDQPTPNKMSGGDLDGDLYQVIFDEDLVKIVE
jgi:hypothetical protein